MPLLVTFKGRPIKRRRRVHGGLKLSFFTAVRGKPGEQLSVTDAQWQTHGRIEFFDPANRPDIRAMAGRIAESIKSTGY